MRYLSIGTGHLAVRDILCHWLGFDAAISFAVLNFGNERRPERFRTGLIDDYVRYLSDREGETPFTELA